jgi:predicted transcriptional regulator
MSTLIEMATDIVSAHASTSSLTRDELVTELKDIFSLLSSLEKRDTDGYEISKETGSVPVVSLRKAFGKEQVTCMICGRQMKTLARHLGSAHHMKPGAYRKEFGIPRTQPLAARNYSEKRRQMAVERGLGENLAKARAARGKGRQKA